MTEPPVPVVLEVRGPLAAFLERDEAACGAVRTAVAGEVSGLLSALGVPGEPSVEVETIPEEAEPHRWAAVRVHGALCRHSPELASRVGAYVTGMHADVRAPSLLESLLAGGSVEAESVPDLARFLGLLAAEAVKLRPSVFLGQAQVGALAAALETTDTSRLAAVLGPILDLHVSLAPAGRLATALRDADGLDPTEARELVATRLSAPTVELLVPDEYRSPLSVPGDDGESMLAFMRRGLYYELGLVLPQLVFAPASDLPPDSFSMRVNNIAVLPRRTLAADECFVNTTPEDLAPKVPGRAATNPATGLPGAVVDASAQSALEERGYTVWDPAGYVVLSVADWLRRAARCFVHTDLVEAQLETLGTAMPAVVAAARSRVSTAELTSALRSLVAEQVSIRDLRLVLERVVDGDYAGAAGRDEILADATTDWFGGAVDSPARDGRLVAFLRAGLNRQITDARGRGTTTVVVYLLDDAIEGLVRASGGAAESLSEDDEDRILAAVRAELDSLPATVTPPHLLAWDDVRTGVLETIAPVFPRLFVLGYRDLVSAANVQPIARLALT